MKDNTNPDYSLRKDINDISKEIYDKRINFLIGSGASHGALNTLSTEYTNNGKEISFEDLASILENDGKKDIARLMFCEKYCKEIIEPSYTMDYKKYADVLNNYVNWLEYIFYLLSIKKNQRYKTLQYFHYKLRFIYRTRSKQNN